MVRLLLICLLFTLQANSVNAESSSEDTFNTGVKFFQQKQYESALTYFKNASAQGMTTNALYFNLGVTQYKLGLYDEATTSFTHLSKDKKFRQIAHYNLGLIAEAQKQKNDAINWYTKTIELDDNKKITRLANNKLDRLLNRKQKNISAYISLAFGNDDNVTNAASNSPTNCSDNYRELYTYIKLPITENTNVKANFYQNEYNVLVTENFEFYSAAITHTLKSENWKFIPEASLLQSTLNKSSYQNIYDFKLTGKRRLTNKDRLAFRYRYSDIQSQNTLYNYLQGNRHQFRIDHKTKVNLGNLRLRYQLEINDRQNSASENYSPTRHIIRARLKHKLNRGFRLSEEISYRISQYDEASGVIRNDNRLRIRIAMSKKFSKHWTSGIRYSYTNNESNINSENYLRNKIQFFVNWNF